MSDPLWDICKPEDGSQESVSDMNTRLLFLDPALTRDGMELHRNGELPAPKHGGDISISELFRRSA